MPSQVFWIMFCLYGNKLHLGSHFNSPSVDHLLQLAHIASVEVKNNPCKLIHRNVYFFVLVIFNQNLNICFRSGMAFLL